MSVTFQSGQLVRLIGIPPNLPADTDDLPTTTLFRLCLGRSFVVAEADRNIVSLDVGEMLGKPAWKHTIYVEPWFLEPASN